MADYVQPLELKTIITGVFAGSPEIFAGIALMTISAMTAYFKTPLSLSLFFIILFSIMFVGVLPNAIVAFVTIIGGLAIGLTLSKLFSR